MDIELTDNIDVTISEGDVVQVIGIRAVAQRAADRLQTFRREWFLDLDFGPNYIRDVFKKSPSLTLVRSILLAQTEIAILDFAGKKEAVIKDFVVVHETSTRLLEVSFVLRDPVTQEEAEAKVVIG